MCSKFRDDQLQSLLADPAWIRFHLLFKTRVVPNFGMKAAELANTCLRGMNIISMLCISTFLEELEFISGSVYRPLCSVINFKARGVQHALHLCSSMTRHTLFTYSDKIRDLLLNRTLFVSYPSRDSFLAGYNEKVWTYEESEQLDKRNGLVASVNELIMDAFRAQKAILVEFCLKEFKKCNFR